MLPLNNTRAVIGVGNTLRKDDGIGIVVLEALKLARDKDAIDYFNFGIASFDILHKINEYARVLIIDAIDASLPAATLKIFGLDQIHTSEEAPHISSHELKLPQLHTLLKKFAIPTKVFVAGIQVADSAFGEGLTPALLDAQPRIVAEIRRFIQNDFSTGI